MGYGRSCCKVFTVSLVPVTVFILAVLFFCGIVLLPVLYTELVDKEQYGIVIDAGSSHTHMYVYSWKVSSQNVTSQVKEYMSCKPSGGGISDYTNATKAGNSIYLCLHGLMKKIPQEYRDNVQVWLGATAGMRLLKYENETLANDILKSLRHTMRHAGVMSHKRARILGGGEEGAAGWITTNYLKGKLRKSYPKKRDLYSVSSYGALDMGGASMQIAFQPSGPINDHNFTAVLFGDEVKLYSRSYLCFGVNEADRRTLAYLAMENNYNYSNLLHPCLPNGSNVTVDKSYLFGDHVCTQDVVPDYEDYSKDSTSITFRGTSNPQQCVSLVQRAMNFSQCFVNATSVVDCGIESVPTDVSKQNFMAFSEFYYAARSFGYSNLNATSLPDFDKAIFKFCKEDFETNHSTSYLSTLKKKCFDGVYVSHALKDGLGFTNSTGQWNISFHQRVNDIDVGWSLGYMLNQTYKIADTPNYVAYPYSSADLIVGMLVLTILTIVFIVFFVFTFSACRKTLKPITTGYTNIS